MGPRQAGADLLVDALVIPGATPPFTAELMAAGGSNLTYRVEDADGRCFAVRRPPHKGVLPTAHDVAREYRIMAALASTPVPVPAVVSFVEDGPTFVMEFVDGLILRDKEQASSLTPAQCRAATDALVDAQVALHAVDVDAVGLGDLGKRTDYVARQLHRWRTQVERGKSRELPLLDELHGRLATAAPPEREGARLAHGDYRFDNAVLGPAMEMRAVLDWELCTLGDPVADFCWSLTYWADPGDEYAFLSESPTLASAFPRRAEVAELYAARSGRSLDDLPYFIAFCWWRMACIVEGVYARRLAGATSGGQSGDLDGIARRVEQLLEVAASQAAAAGI